MQNCLYLYSYIHLDRTLWHLVADYQLLIIAIAHSDAQTVAPLILEIDVFSRKITARK